MNAIYFFAGESSGDLHGSHLIAALKNRDPFLKAIGVGGPKMREEGLTGNIPMEAFQVMGFSDVIKKLPQLLSLFFKVRHEILESNPKTVILIDYPGFNLRLAASLRKKGYSGKIVQYICPTVWAHGKNRIETLAKHFDLLLTIYPFEKEYFTATSLKVEYIGNPLVTTLKNHPYDPNWQSSVGIKNASHIIALFPGSRSSEIKAHLPAQLKCCETLAKQDKNLIFALSCAHEKFKEQLQKSASSSHLKLGKNLFIIPPQFRWELMRDASLAIAKSGTVTLELALHSVPTVVHYHLSWMNFLFAKYFLRLNLPHYCIVNILMQETVFKECIGYRIAEEKLSSEVQKLFENKLEQENIRSKCRDCKTMLQEIASHEKGAECIS